MNTDSPVSDIAKATVVAGTVSFFGCEETRTQWYARYSDDSYSYCEEVPMD